MKIGLIGNMNNNNFSLLRYFRDLGADAHLLLYAEDGQGSLSHFQPSADTWHLERWTPYIHQTAIPNTPIAALDFPFSWLMSARSFLKAKWGGNPTWVAPVSRSQVRSTYAAYDRLLASGLSPATLQRIARRLDIFYPYAIQVEFLEAPQFTSWLHSARGLTRYGLRLLRQRQARGIRAATRVFNADPGITHETLVRHGARPLAMAIPMVYPHEDLPIAPPTEHLRQAQSQARAASFSALHHARLIWQNPGHWTPAEWRSENKNAPRFFRALAQLLQQRPTAQPRVFVVEYGPDVAATRSLISDLGLDPFVTWLPLMPRKELMWLLAQVSLAVGQFYDVPRMIWGGTGWEALASGKPILQGFQFADGEFESLYGYPAPPLLGVRTEADILAALLSVADRPEHLAAIGTAARAWFDRHNGIGLARQWLEQLTNSHGPEYR